MHWEIRLRQHLESVLYGSGSEVVSKAGGLFEA